MLDASVLSDRRGPALFSLLTIRTSGRSSQGADEFRTRLGRQPDRPAGDPTDPIEKLGGGGRQALATLLDQYRDRLRRMVELRLDPRLRARLDASDVVQEAFLDVARDLDAYLAGPKLPPLLWLRLHVGRRLTTLHRQHLGTKMREAGREISLYQGALPQASPAALASILLARHTPPSQAAQRAERMLRVQEALNSLDSIDREMLALRHFESSSAPRRPWCSGSARRPGPSGTSAP
jgi:RNA polymerase sigma-70 factor, ECF subfamily